MAKEKSKPRKTREERQARLLEREEVPISRKEQNKIYSADVTAQRLTEGLEFED